MFCTRCGTLNSDQVRFCSGCGTPIGTAAPASATPPAAGLAIPVAAAPALVYTAGRPVQYAGFWRRFAALIIDSLIFTPLLLIFIGTSGIFTAITSPRGMGDESLGIAMILSIIMMVVVGVCGGWLYSTAMESSRHQGTLGKMAMGIKVTDMDGNRISFARSNGRFFGKWVSGAIMNIGYLMAAFTEKKQALHDILANCLVVRK